MFSRKARNCIEYKKKGSILPIICFSATIGCMAMTFRNILTASRILKDEEQEEFREGGINELQKTEIM